MKKTAELQKKQDEYWQGRAKSFDSHYVSGWFVRAFLAHRSRLVLRMLGHARFGRLADVGCGSGVHIVQMAAHAGELVGFDYSAQMVELARQRLQHAGVRNARIEQCDAYDLRAGDATFDAILCLGLLDYLTDPVRVLAEMRRIGKPGARVVFSIPKRPSLFSFLRRGVGLRLREWLFDLPPILTDVSRAELERLVADGGFELQQVRPLWTTMWLAAVRKPAAEGTEG